jgi:hypothetical protein
VTETSVDKYQSPVANSVDEYHNATENPNNLPVNEYDYVVKNPEISNINEYHDPVANPDDLQSNIFGLLNENLGKI